MSEIKGNKAVEDAAIAWVMDLERQAGRNPIDTRYNPKAPGDIESPPRTIEVKAFGKSNRGYDLWLEVAQVEEAKKNPDFYLYVVENVGQGDPGKFTLKVLQGEHLRRLLERAKEQSYFTVPWPTRDYDATPFGLRDMSESPAAPGVTPNASACISSGDAEASPFTEKEDSMSPSDGSDSTRLSACTYDYEKLDEVARQLGSPPRELHINEIIDQAGKLLPDFRNKRADSISATMDYRTINIRGRATKAGDFERSDDWNRDPRFMKVGRGIYRRLSEAERKRFKELWQHNELLLRQASFDAAEWGRLMGQR